MSDEAPDYRGLRWRGSGDWVDISVGKLTEMFARLDAAERERDALREALQAVLKVRVEGYENIWAGTNRCQAIARAALTANYSAPQEQQP